MVNFIIDRQKGVNHTTLVVIDPDAVLLEWGARLVQYNTGGQFSTEKCRLHLNISKLKAAIFGLKALCKNEFNSHILIQIDSTSHK